MMLKVKISDWMDLVQDDSVPIHTQDIVSSASMKEVVLSKIKDERIPKQCRRSWVKLVILAAVIGIMVTSVAAIELHQGWIHFFSSAAQAEQAAQAGAQNGIAGYGIYSGADYNERDMLERANRVMETPVDGDRCYQADCLSDLSGIWDTNLNLSWLEQHYEAVPGTHLAILQTRTEETEPYSVSVVGEYRGEKGELFNLQYYFDTEKEPSESYCVVSGNYEYYQTADGVTAAISMDWSKTGKSVFWVELQYGQVTFAMHGTQMELEEIKEILDNLDLSGVMR